jgi:SEC-C motif-containing protein
MVFSVSRMIDHDACPCGSGTTYAVCCGPFHSHAQSPATAVQLMRSRYSAHVLALEAYLLETWHGSTRSPALPLRDAEPVQWLGLRIVCTQQGGVADREGVVEFVARCKGRGRAARLHETSRFVQEAGRWYYLDGVIGR